MSAEYRSDIDGLRAIAVSAVVAYHAFPSAVSGGFIGVDIFFVISGYLITTIIARQMEDGRFRFADFFARRVRRLLPALCLVLAFCLLAGYQLLLPKEYVDLGKHIIYGAFFATNFALVTEVGYFDKAAEYKLLVHLWSLSVEEQFYILWPVILGTLMVFKASVIRIILVMGFLSFCLSIWFVIHHPQIAFFWPFGRFWELLAGALIALLPTGSQSVMQQKLGLSSPRHLANLCGFAGLFLLIAGIFVITPHTGFPGWWALLPVTGASLLIWGGQGSWVNSVVLSQRALVAIGLISYPLYLWHWPLLTFPTIVQGAAPAITVRLLAVAAAVLLSIMTYRYVEKPIRFGALKNHGSRTAKALVASLLVLSACGATLYMKKGLPERSSLAAYEQTVSALVRTPAVDSYCDRLLNGQDRLFDYCRAQPVAGAQEIVAVIGDSHAHAGYPGIAEAGSVFGYETQLYANSSCPPLVGAIWGRTDSEKAQCKAKIAQILSLVTANERIKKVVFLTRGTTYWDGTEPAQTASQATQPTMSYQAFSQGLIASIETLQAAGKQVIYVAENPELTKQASSCAPRPYHIGDRCAQNIEDVKDRQKAYLALMARLPEGVVRHTIGVFCPDGVCVAVDEAAQLLYADDDHLSVEGSRLQFDQIIKPALLSHKK